MNKWIKVEDRIPVEGMKVITTNSEDDYWVEHMDSYSVACLKGEEYDIYWHGITHWMPLPDSPHISLHKVHT